LTINRDVSKFQSQYGATTETAERLGAPSSTGRSSRNSVTELKSLVERNQPAKRTSMKNIWPGLANVSEH